jgi:hypothetical protein
MSAGPESTAFEPPNLRDRGQDHGGTRQRGAGRAALAQAMWILMERAGWLHRPLDSSASGDKCRNAY